MRVAENTSGQTWNRIRTEAQRIHAVTFTGPAGQFCKTTQLSKDPARPVRRPRYRSAENDPRHHPRDALTSNHAKASPAQASATTSRA
jgi:hypothetical protein